MSELRKSKRKLVLSKEENEYEENKKTKAVFTEGDDISLLKAMNEYEMTNQANPYDEMGKFLSFVKPFLSFEIQRKQLTNRLWRLRNKYDYSDYDLSKPHHAKLLELSKLIRAWGCNENMSLDGENVGDGQNVGGVNVVVGKSSKVVENKGKGKVDENKGKGKVVTCDGRNVKQDNLAIGDADVLNEGLNVGKKERKQSKDGQNVVNLDGQKVQGDKVVVGDFDVGKSSKGVENKEKGKGVENKEKGKVVTASMFPELTNMLELETLSKMPQHLKKKFVRDTIDSMGWEKANKLEEDWVDVRLLEMELKAKTLELTSKAMNLILEATLTSMK